MFLQSFRKSGLLILMLSILFTAMGVTPAYAIAAPTPLAPANGSTTNSTDTPPLAVPEFKWAPVSGAISYRLQVSKDIAYTTKVVDIVTYNTSYTPVTIGSTWTDGTYYWQVRVETPTPVSAYSDTWTFTKEWATFDNLPTLTSPDDNATLDFYDSPIFSWTPVTGASKYILQVSTSPSSWTVLSFTETTIYTTHQPEARLNNGTYYWRVIPVDPGLHNGTPSEVRSFTIGYSHIPTLLEPADNAFPTFTPTFRWTAVRGAKFYRLEYTTDSSFASGITAIETNNVAHTPVNTIENDQNYYWRVRAHTSTTNASDWSAVRTFIKKWYIKPQLLTPTNSYQHQRFPMFSWTPVPGARSYFVELSKDINFASVYDSATVANPFWIPSKYDGSTLTYYWRVTPIDGKGYDGLVSDTGSYVSYAGSLAPHQVYPLYYYPPNQFSGFPGVTTNPYEDRTVAYPIFIWQRVYKPFDALPIPGEIYPEAYRVQVSSDPTFTSVTWQVDTENTSAAPTQSNPFTPVVGTDYYWRVRPLIGGAEAGQWSQVWRTRFNPALGVAATSGAAPELLRPITGSEFAESTPLLSWKALSGATAYDVQISQDSAFGTTVDTATVSSPMYVPTQGLAQRSLGDLDFGVYYWRVRKSPNGTWSETRRFQIAAQSQWQDTRTLGTTTGNLQIGSDPAGDVASDYDVTSLHVAQARQFWYFGFDVPTTASQNITYAMYLDQDHKANSGATSDPRGYTVSLNSAFLPEYAIYLLQESGAFSTTKAYLYKWNGASWNTVQVFSDIGGLITRTGDYVEFSLPSTTVGHQDSTGSYAISLVSLPASSGQPQDSVPSDPNVPGGGTITRFANVTERTNLLTPLDDTNATTTLYSSLPPFFSDWPILAPWSGFHAKVYLDPLFTSEVATYTMTASVAYFGDSTRVWPDDLDGDNTYYWRIQPRYRVGGTLYNGVWSQGWRVERKGLIPSNLQTSVTFATPTFSWDMMEGTEFYTLQVDDDPNFGSTAINITTQQTSYTMTGTLANATYHWRVRAHRYSGVTNSWSPTQSFTLNLPIPTGMTHTPSGVANRAPTLSWNPVLKDDGVNPVFAAYKYRVQVSKDPGFASIWDTIDTEQTSWTPSKGYDDGTYYWRIAILDGQNKLGAYSATQTFTKQYPITSLVSPTSGSTVLGTPTFIWTPVAGADKYKLEVSKSVNFSPIYESIITNSVRYTPTKKYDVLTTYYWRVAVMDKDSKVGPFNTATIIVSPVKKTLTFRSTGSQDGWIPETGENTNLGGAPSVTATTLRLGDDAARKQYRSVLSFNTSSLPDNAIITKVTLRLQKQGIIGGGNPVSAFKGFMIVIKKGFFGSKNTLEAGDFQASGNQTLGPFVTAISGSWYPINLLAAKANINLTTSSSGLTQIRLAFKLDDNNNAQANYLSLYSGNAPTANRPQLVIEYYIP